MMNFSWEMLKALCAGQGIGRVMMDREIANSVDLKGLVLDTGGRGEHSYRRIFRRPTAAKVWVLDICADRTVDIRGSITSLPIASGSCDVILCFNVLEHVFDYQSALREVQRVLKLNGVFYGRVPFLMNVHMDPSDHWRYTRQALEKLLQAADFNDIVVKPNGGLFLVILNLLGPIWRRIGCIQVVFVPLFLVLNCLFEAVVGDSVNRERYPLGYFFSARAKD